MADSILTAFDGGIGSVEVIDYDAPAFERIEAALLTQALEQEIGGHILGVTEADLCSSNDGDTTCSMFGGKDHRNDVAVVSPRRLGPGTAELLQQRLCKVALHELGHNFGLVHHYALIAARDEGCCPMSKGEYNGFGEVGYVRAVIDQRGYSFCDACLDFIRRRRCLAC
jgi:predicted Zn-dependent protease